MGARALRGGAGAGAWPTIGGVPHAAAETTPAAHALPALIARQIAQAGGWLPFDRFMHLALYAPQLGYYSGGRHPFGAGGDFVTAPELSPLFGRALAAQVAEALGATGSDVVWEFGAGSGALAAQVLAALDAAGQPVRSYRIVEVSATLRQRQRQRLAPWADRVQWLDALPEAMHGVVIGNEVLDAMPVKLLARTGGVWHERGVALAADHGLEPNQPLALVHAAKAAMDNVANPFIWQDRPTALRPPIPVEGTHDVVTEIHPQGHAFVATLAERLARGAQTAPGQGGGAVFLIDYGFPEAEYYHPQRTGGTLVCHRAHRVDDEPLADAGDKDITAHVNFTGVALAAQDAGLTALGYTSQGRFLANCGIGPMMDAADLPTRANAFKLLAEHEMGELFKVIGLATGEGWDALGFAAGDRTDRL